MSNSEREITEAVRHLRLTEAQLTKCDPAKAAEVAGTAKMRFVDDNPRVWWLGFTQPYESHSYGAPEEWERRLIEAIPRGTTRCWLITESDCETYSVYDAQVATIAALLKECSFFEYYLVDPNFRWILADTDHNRIIVAMPIDAHVVKSSN